MLAWGFNKGDHKTEKVLLISPGLLSTSKANYIQTVVANMDKLGYKCVLIVNRGLEVPLLVFCFYRLNVFCFFKICSKKCYFRFYKEIIKSFVHYEYYLFNLFRYLFFNLFLNGSKTLQYVVTICYYN